LALTWVHQKAEHKVRSGELVLKDGANGEKKVKQGDTQSITD
jgi:hypothetical protein